MGKDSWILDAIKGSAFGTKLSALKKFLFEKSKVEDLTKCALCPNMCRFSCPISIVDGKETTSPAGKSRIAFLLRKGYIEKNIENVLPLYYCLSCNVCSTWCPFEFSVGDVIRPIRGEIMRQGVYPESLRDVLENLRNYHCVYGEIEGNAQYPKDGDTLYIRGCLVRKFYPQATDKAIELLRILGYNPLILDNEKCCGYLAYEIGDDDTFIEIATKNAEELNSLGINTIVTACPECAYTYRVLYPQYKIKIKAKVYHITEIIKMHLDKLNFREKKETVTIHDPSKLAINLDQPNILTDILSRIPKLKVKLPMRHGKNTFECGNGNNLLTWIDADLLEMINLERLKELNEESEIIITASYACKKGLEDVGGKVYDITEYVLDAIKKD